MAEAVDWVRRCPAPAGVDVEIGIRQVVAAEDCGPNFTPELREREERLRAQVAQKQ